MSAPKTLLDDAAALYLSQLCIPSLAGDVDTLTAALAYAQAGWFLVPVKKGSKNPGSVVGSGWEMKSSRDPKQIAAWFAGTDHGIALHIGRSGAVAFDVDNADELPLLLAAALTRYPAPRQTTRAGSHELGGHFLYATPPGRRLGNSKGQLAGPWGEVRGRNGVLIVAPSIHAKADEGGLYRWARTGPVPPLPTELADALGDAVDSAGAATDTEVTSFLNKHTAATAGYLLDSRVRGMVAKFATGESRHPTAVPFTVGAMNEAACGYYPAAAAADQLRIAFVNALTQARPGDPTARIASRQEANDEFDGILAWAVGQVTPVSIAETVARIDQRAAERQLSGFLRFDPTGAAGGSVGPTYHPSDESAPPTALGPARPTPETTPPTPEPAATETPAELWERPVMHHIYDFARSRGVSPLAMLGCLLARATAMLPPEYVLPAIVGTKGSFNMFVALVGRSGAGKGASHGASRDAIQFVTGRRGGLQNDWVDPLSRGFLYSVDVGSGEGLIQAFATWDKKEEVVRQFRSCVLFNVAEVDQLAAVGSRQGATLLPVLRKAWSGEELGMQYADPTKRLRLADHTYRCNAIVGVQPGRAVRRIEPSGDSDLGGGPVLTLQAGAIGKAQALHRDQCRLSPQVRPEFSDFDAALTLHRGSCGPRYA